MNLEEMIVEKRAIRVEKQNQKRVKEEKAFQARCDKLKPMLEKLKILGKYGYVVKLHTDKKHFPCPAIHARIKGNNTNYDKFGEIFLTDAEGIRWKSGGCNSHRHEHETDEDLLEFIATQVAEKH